MICANFWCEISWSTNPVQEDTGGKKENKRNEVVQWQRTKIGGDTLEGPRPNWNDHIICNEDEVFSKFRYFTFK